MSNSVRSAMVLTMLLLICGEGAVGEDGGLASFWPKDSPPKQWDLIAVSAKSTPNPQILMSVANQNISENKFVLWFFNKQGQKPGDRQGESYRVCENPKRAWLYLDSYVDVNNQGSAVHPVEVDRALLITEGEDPIDLLADGEHRVCGETGQPYLIWSPTARIYRMKVWGHLVENVKWRWFWDAEVTSGETIENDCLAPVERRPAVKVQEAYWSNFTAPAGQWSLGSGEIDSATGWPTGRSVAFGRTVWHGAGRIPYFMTGGADSIPTWCVNRIVPTTDGVGFRKAE